MIAKGKEALVLEQSCTYVGVEAADAVEPVWLDAASYKICRRSTYVRTYVCGTHASKCEFYTYTNVRTLGQAPIHARDRMRAYALMKLQTTTFLVDHYLANWFHGW